MRTWRFLGVPLILLSTTAVSCGDDPPAAATPSPFIANFNGFHSEATVLTEVAGGECVGNDLRTRLGSVDFGTVTISQKEADVTAILRSATTGLECTYQGTASIGGFAVSSRSCDAAKILFGCSNGNARILELVRSTITASMTGTATTGNVATSYNVFSPATEDAPQTPVGGLVIQEQFAARRR
jgi:hypothetical protein